MPNWLKWLLGLGAACAALGAWLVLADVPARLAPQDPALRAQAELRRIGREHERVTALLDRVLRAEVLRARAPADRVLLVDLGTDSLPDLAEAVRTAAAAEYAPAVAPRVPVMVIVMTGRRYAWYDMSSVSPSWGAEYFASTTEDASFCAVALDTAHVGSLRIRARSPVLNLDRKPLGPCRLWARYGAPGPGVQAWLAAGAMHFARDPDVLRPLPDSLRAPRLFGAPRALPLNLALQACLTHHVSACRRALLRPLAGLRMAENPAGVVVTDRRYWSWHESEAPMHLVAALEADFGMERFGRFWTSSADVETAFRDAFGESLESWGMRTLQGVFGRAPAGPRLAAATLVLSFVTLGLLVAVAVAAARRRTVG